MSEEHCQLVEWLGAPEPLSALVRMQEADPSLAYLRIASKTERRRRQAPV